VIHDIERLGEVELTAIGIGHDVTRYYRRADLFDEDRSSNTRLRSRRAA
jgi:cobalamin biosynthesis protein CobT